MIENVQQYLRIIKTRKQTGAVLNAVLNEINDEALFKRAESRTEWLAEWVVNVGKIIDPITYNTALDQSHEIWCEDSSSAER